MYTCIDGVFYNADTMVNIQKELALDTWRVSDREDCTIACWRKLTK